MPDPASTGYRPEDIEEFVADLLRLRTGMHRRGERTRPVVTTADECQAAFELPAAPVTPGFARLARMGRAAGMTVVTTANRAEGRPLRAACPCPDHPGRPVDARSDQPGPPEVA